MSSGPSWKCYEEKVYDDTPCSPEHYVMHGGFGCSTGSLQECFLSGEYYYNDVLIYSYNTQEDCETASMSNNCQPS